MSLKHWMLSHLSRAGQFAGRADLQPREPVLEAVPNGGVRREREGEGADHLGPYAALVAAVRDELEHFVASHVRMHLAIAEHDRFMLTGIGVRCIDGAAGARALLEQFMREFRPEQIKRFLAREVIAALPNAAAIDLSQFAGLHDADAPASADAQGEYAELIAALANVPATASRSFDVSIVGRWREADAAPPRTAPSLATVPAVRAARSAPPAMATPLAGARAVEFELDDADGRRRVALAAVLPGRRYAIGSGEGCDLRVAGTYTSRRHAELWHDGEGWWVGDAGSTNGVRVEPADRDGAAAPQAVDQPVPLAPGARIVLSARADGPPADYPRIVLRAAPAAPARITPIATMAPGAAQAAAPRTLLTAVLTGPAAAPWRITLAHAGGTRSLDLRAAALPASLGRSRNQTLVVHRDHEAVSGHHLDIVALDDDGVDVVVHGDNGIEIDGVDHLAGSRLRWRAGQTMRLGTAAPQQPRCEVTLERRAD
jgi:hypothetical protein